MLPNPNGKRSEWSLQCLNDGNDGNGNAAEDAIVYDYELFMLFQRRKHNDDDEAKKKKKWSEV